MSGRFRPVFCACAALLLAVAISARAATPTASISASPVTGRAPLPVFFDASTSSADAITFLWEFGDGAASTAKTVNHIYNVAGTYIAKLTVANAEGASASSQIAITVTGSTEGPVTGDMNFRWATTASTFTLKHGQTGRDSFKLAAAFNTVDLPGSVEGLAASFSINGSFVISGVLGELGGLLNPERQRAPTFFLQVSTAEQLLIVEIGRANLKDALAISGAFNATVSSAQVPVTFSLTIGAQTYTVTENFTYVSSAGGTGRGEFNIKKKTGSVDDGFFVVSRASALENGDGNGHFFEFEAYLSRPMAKLITTPGAGGFTIKLNEADKELILFDRLKRNGTKINYDQSDRDLSGVSRLSIDTESRRMTIRTWDIRSDETIGGTGLPTRGRPLTAFNFAIRLDLDQADGTVFQAVTATRMTRRTKDDAFWQTGRRAKR